MRLSVCDIHIHLAIQTFIQLDTRKNIKRKFEKVFLWLTIRRIHMPLMDKMSIKSVI